MLILLMLINKVGKQVKNNENHLISFLKLFNLFLFFFLINAYSFIKKYTY